MTAIRAAIVCACLAGVAAATGDPRAPVEDDWEPPAKLSAYGLFRDAAAQQPAADVLPYDVNTPLFSDYSVKDRFVRLPAGTRARYHEVDDFEFPVGTILVKTFAIQHDLRDPAKGRRLIETRLLIRRPEDWVGLTYIWNDAATEATLETIGATRAVRWVHTDGSPRSLDYIIPSKNQCMSCHENRRVLRPIGLKARHLNRDYAYADGRENQLVRWQRQGLLEGAPSPDTAPRLPVWNDPRTGTLDRRARAYLEMNCAHCHNPNGPARTSGLDLLAAQDDARKWGVGKPPIAAGRGTGGRAFDIVPGQPDASILLFRMQSTDPGVMMPELPRRLVDAEGVALIREWIGRMPKPGP